MHLGKTNYSEGGEINYFVTNLMGIFGSSNYVRLKLIKI